MDLRTDNALVIDAVMVVLVIRMGEDKGLGKQEGHAKAQKKHKRGQALCV